MSQSMKLWVTCALLLPTAAAHAATERTSCEMLADLSLQDTRIISAATVTGESFTPPGASQPIADLPSFCRVTGVISPAINFEVWLPLAGWNGKFLGTGNGGYNGVIVYSALEAGLRKGYATVNTDMGHVKTEPDPAAWAMGRPDLVIDQAYRAQHETAVKAKRIVDAFYGSPPRYSYFNGCSAGGWQALTEAQRYPDDYDGIVAGAPASEIIHLHAATIWTHLAAKKIPAAKLRLITDTVLNKCDARDGANDRLLGNPPACDFQPEELACKADEPIDSCLTPDEATALRDIYQGARTSSGEQIYPGWPRGSEYALTALQGPLFAELSAGTFRNMIFEDPDWTYDQLDLDRDVKIADEKLGAVLNASTADLSAFRRAGGKLILWHGWDDPAISALHTVDYYQRVASHFARPGDSAAKSIDRVQDFARLFMAPGVQHCGGGPGPSSFDMLALLERWVEHGTAPERIPASSRAQDSVDRSRPLCLYPKIAVYRGSGSMDKAENFVCRKP